MFIGWDRGASKASSVGSPKVEAKRQDTRLFRQLVERVHALETAMPAPKPEPVAVVPDIVPPIPIEAPAPVETEGFS